MSSTMIDRAKIAINAKTDLALAEFLCVNASTIAGYHRRQTVPLEQCIKIAERTGVSLDWLILGKGDINTPNKQAAEPSAQPADVQMLLAGWNGLNPQAKARILQQVLAELNNTEQSHD